MNDLAQVLANDLAGMTVATDRPGWLAALQERAYAHFSEAGLPRPGEERWKYTSLRTLERRKPGLGRAAGDGQGAAVPAPLLDGITRVCMVDGAYSLREGSLPGGMTVMPLGEALESGAEDLRELLESLRLEGSADGFATLNTAAISQGLFVHLRPGTDGGRVLLQWLGAPGGDADLYNSRICVLLEEGARLELLEQFEGAPDTDPMLNLVMQCRLGPGSELRHTRLQHWPAGAVLVSRADVHQAADSRYLHTGLDLGGGLVRHDFNTLLAGPGASCSLHSGCVTSGRRHVDNHIDVDHLSPGCSSNQVFRGVLGDRSRAVFNGRVLVAPGADGTEARQSSAGLLLSPHAEIDAKPELEIYADEVVASHGATVGQLDEDAIFYLRSRGLDEAAARNVLTLAFCRSVLDPLPSRALREALGERLHRALAAGGVTGD